MPSSAWKHLVEVLWSSAVGVALIISIASITASGSIVEDLWMLTRTVGLVAIVITWIYILYEVAVQGTSYEWIPLLIGFIVSMLLALIYIAVENVETHTIEPLRYFIFSSLTHTLLLLLPKKKNSD